MSIKLFKCILAAALIAGSAATANAATYIELSGTNVDFYYDADFWGEGTGSLSGNTLTFALDDMEAAATGRPNRIVSNGIDGGASQQVTIYAVAHSGYQVGSYVDHGFNGSVSVPTYASYAYLYNASQSWTGILANGNFIVGDYAGAGGVDYGHANSTGLPESYSVTRSGNSLSDGNPVYQSIMGFSPYFGAYVSQHGAGVSTASLSDVNYAFSVSPVPESETYALLIAGVALLSVFGRRKHQA